MPKTVFLSHSSKDKTFARRLASDLAARGLKVWVDEAEMRLGDSLIGRLEAAIDDNDYLAVILSPHSIKSEWVLKEVRMALHREIDGKRVIVLPLLYRDCKLPGFLRDKLYADFRDDADYDLGLQSVLIRVAADRFSDPEARQALDAFERFLFQRRWRAALRTGVLSESFLNYLKTTFRSLSARRRRFGVSVLTSYVLFLTELIERGSLTPEVWQFCSAIIEDERINLGIRFLTLDRVLPAAVPLLKVGQVHFPDLLKGPDPNRGHTLVHLVVKSWENREEYASFMFDRDSPRRILSAYWRFADVAKRRALLDTLPQVLREIGAHSSQLVALRDHDIHDHTAVDTVLRDVTPGFTDGATGKAGRRVLDRMADGESSDDLPKALQGFRAALKSEESGDYRPRDALMDFWTPKYLDHLTAKRGEPFVFKFLSAVTQDPDISVAHSAVALLAIVARFDREALLLDDGLLDTVLQAKTRGQWKSSVIEVLCDLVCTDGSDDSGFEALVAVCTAFSKGQRPHFGRVVSKFSSKSRRLALLESFANGDINGSQFLKRLKNGKRKQVKSRAHLQLDTL